MFVRLTHMFTFFNDSKEHFIHLNLISLVKTISSLIFIILNLFNIPTFFKVYIKVISIHRKYSNTNFIVFFFTKKKKSTFWLKLPCRQIIIEAISSALPPQTLSQKNWIRNDTCSKVPVGLVCFQQCHNILGRTGPWAISHEVGEPPGKGKRRHDSVVWRDSHLSRSSWLHWWAQNLKGKRTM